MPALLITAIAVFGAFVCWRAWKWLWQETDDIIDVFDLDDPKDFH